MGYGTSVLPSGAVGSMIGRFMPDIQLDVFPAVRTETAAARAIASFTTTPVSLGGDPTLTIVTDSNRPRLTWWVIVRAGDFRSWTVVVDATDGTVLRTMQNWIDG